MKGNQMQIMSERVEEDGRGLTAVNGGRMARMNSNRGNREKKIKVLTRNRKKIIQGIMPK